MQPIYIPHLLNAVGRTKTLTYETFFEDLETLTPVLAHLSVRHGTTFLEVKGSASTIVTLTCDRCLQQYNHRLIVDAQEIIWLTKRLSVSGAEEPLEQEVNLEDLVESLPPDGYFDPETWMYEQICLELPQRRICDSECQGIIPPQRPSPDSDSSADAVDHRWSALAVLRRQLSSEDVQNTSSEDSQSN